MERDRPNASSAIAATVLIVSGAVLLTIVPIGHVVVARQRPVQIVDQAVNESGSASTSKHNEGRRLFEKETFGGNGRTCETCHSRETGTVSAEDAQRRMSRDPRDPLFLGDGSDDGAGTGAERRLTHATVLVKVPLAGNVRLAADSTAATAIFRRGIPTTLNAPALDRVLMWDGRHHNLDEQALSAILGHAEAARTPSAKELERIAEF